MPLADVYVTLCKKDKCKAACPHMAITTMEMNQYWKEIYYAGTAQSLHVGL